MNVITLSNKKFSLLQPLAISREVISTEAQLYDFNYKGKKKVLKKLFYNEGEIFENKLYTLEMLDINREYLPNSFCIPEALVSVAGNIKGFILPKIPGHSLTSILNEKNLDTNEQVYYLKKVGEILEQLNAIRKFTPLNDIFIGDLHDSNFIVNKDNKQVTVIDLDSCKIKDNQSMYGRFLTPISLLTNVKGKYKIDEFGKIGYVIADKESDLYCYTVMVLNYLLGKNENIDNLKLEEYYEYLNYLEYIGVNRNLLDVFYGIVSNTPNENPMPYLDSLDRTTIFRAKAKVYKKVRPQRKA